MIGLVYSTVQVRIGLDRVEVVTGEVGNLKLDEADDFDARVDIIQAFSV